MYRTRDGSSSFLVTQFEPLEARKAFPSFDEPRFKTPFEVTIVAPAGQQVAANAPLRSSEALPGGALQRHVFQPTAPLPTYLVAWTVGPYEIIEAEPIEAQGTSTPFRVLVPPGKSHLAQVALARTPELLALLGDYFGQPYPFAKLDLVAVPNFSAGAMENVGLVTFRDSILLLEEETSTPAARYRALNIIAHELAHMWFGNLVTPPWWDELWLNESFATWMATDVMERFDPSLKPSLRQLERAASVMRSDTLAEARALRQPIALQGDVYNAFDGITYAKGASVLRMVERWIGPQRFRQAVRNLMIQQSYGEVTTELLLAALESTSEEGAGEVSAVLLSYLDQPGVPRVTATLRCAGSGAQVELTQRRHLPAESRAQADGLWTIPVCLKVARGDSSSVQCEVLSAREQSVALQGSGCPDFIHPNADESGYYQWEMSPEATLGLAEALKQGRLSAREQLALLPQMEASVRVGRLDVSALYDMALELVALPDSEIASEALDVLTSMAADASAAGLEEAYAAMLRERLSGQLERLGYVPRRDEEMADATLRSKVLWVLGFSARDVAVMANAKGLVPLFLDEPEAFPSWHNWALWLAATEGDALLWEALRQRAVSAKTPAVRHAALAALGRFRDPKLLEQSLALFLTEEVRSNEFWTLFGAGAGDEALLEQVVWPFVTSHYEAIVEKMGVAFGAPSLPFIGANACDPEGRARLEAFFSKPQRLKQGMKRNLATSLESIALCSTRRRARQSALSAVLEPYTVQKTPPP